MVTNPTHIALQQTQNWIKKIVIDLNLCPFAAPVFNTNRIDYILSSGHDMTPHLHHLAQCFTTLDTNTDIETSLLVFPDAYPEFTDFLDLLSIANDLLDDLNYSGVYQLASFHPRYCFENSKKEDASNFTNRSPYPMLHVLRESSIEKAVEMYRDINAVPDNNIKKLRAVGYEAMCNQIKEISKH